MFERAKNVSDLDNYLQSLGRDDDGDVHKKQFYQSLQNYYRRKW
jgi:hypothetical protein